MHTPGQHHDAADELSELERQQLLPYLTDTAPPWFGPAIAVAVAVFVASYDIENAAIQIVAMLLYALTIGALVGLKVRRNGFQPRFDRAPRPIIREILIGVVVLTVIGVIGVGLAATTSFRYRFTVAGVVLGAATWVWFAVFTARYQRVARRLADEAGITLP